jgi:hypothetical protein
MANGLLPEDHQNWQLLLRLGARPNLTTACRAMRMTEAQKKKQAKYKRKGKNNGETMGSSNSR